MAIIIADIHADIQKARAFLAYEPQSEHIILGDLVDARNQKVSFDAELECLELLIASESVLLWGNHDLAYTPEQPWGCYTEFSWIHDSEVNSYTCQSDYLLKKYQANGDLWYRDIFEDRYQAAKTNGRFRAAYAVDGWLCSHAGISPGVADIIPLEIISAGASSIADWLNEEFQLEFRTPANKTCDGRQPRLGVGPLFQIHRCRFGDDPFGGIFWFDPIGEMTDPSPVVGKQIYGHTPVPYPEIGEYWVNLNAFEEDGIWVFDTQENCLKEIGSGENIPVGVPA